MNTLSAAAIITSFLCGLSLLLLAAWSRHKKSGTGPLMLSGARGRVEHPLTPTGTVLLKGELWPARTPDGQHLPANAEILVIGASACNLEVTPVDKNRHF